MGGQLAAEHLLEYVGQFVRGRRRPWAAFASFIDSHEDSDTLAAALDAPLSSFLTRLELS